MKLKMIFFIAIIILLVSLIGYNYETPIEKFCKPDKDFYVDWEVSEEQRLILGLADKVNKALSFDFIGRKNIKEILSVRRGNCLSHSILLKACLDVYGFESSVEVVEFSNSYHSYVGVMVDGNISIIDATMNEQSRTELLLLKSVNFNYYQSVLLEGYIESEKEK